MALSDAERLSPTASVDEYRGPFNLDEVDHLYEEEKILDAARLLLKMEHRDKLPEKYRSIIDLAEEFENAIADITGPPDESSDWTKQGEHQGKWPTLLYNKFDEEVRLSVRIETPIEASLLVPLLSVLNETDAYDTWMPSFKLPKAGLQESNQLECAGRADQTVQLLFDLPWPLAKKEVIIHAVAVDEIDTQQYIVVRLNTLKEGHPVVPPLAKGVDRVDFNGAILFRACPPDHELLANHTSDEPLVLVSFKM